MPEQVTDPYDVLAQLNQVFISAGWLVDLEVVDTEWGPRIRIPKGMSLAHVKELILTIEAGIQTRVIKK